MIFAVLLVGLTLSNIVACIIYGISDGTILIRISDLPYISYALISLLLSAVLLFVVKKNIK